MAQQPASSARRPGRWRLLIWWLLPLLYLAWLTHNALPLLPHLRQTQPGAFLAKLIALPALPAVAGMTFLPQTVAALPIVVVASVAFLTLVLLALTVGPRSVAPIAPVATPISLADALLPAAAPQPAFSQSAPIPITSVAPDTTVALLGMLTAETSNASTTTLDVRPTTVSSVDQSRQRHIFVSHASADDTFGSWLVDRLRAELRSVDAVWYDSRGESPDTINWSGGIRPASYWEQEVFLELRTRPIFVVLLSPASLASSWVNDEVLLAWKQKNERGRQQSKVIVPVIVPDARDLALPEPLDLIQTVSFVEREDWTAEQAFQALLVAIRADQTELRRGEAEPPFDLAVLPVPGRFIGRETDLQWVLKRLEPRSTAAITAIRGLGGIGKTALAAVSVQRAFEERRFPGGIAVQVCYDLRDPAELLKRVLSSFDSDRRQPETNDLKTLAEVAHRLLRGHRVLVVLDNVEPDDADPTGAWKLERVVTPLRQAGAALLITARQVLPTSAVPLSESLELSLLSSDEALELFANTMGLTSVDQLAPSDRASMERIVHALDRHTLAVKLAGAYAGSMRRDLKELARELENPSRAIALPDGETPRAVGLAFARSVDALRQDERRLFAALSAFATNEFGRQAAIALGTAIGVEDPEASVDLLALRALLAPREETSMPAESDRERLRLHPLLHGFARMQWGHWTEVEREQACQGVADHFVQYLDSVGESHSAHYADEANVVGAIEWAHLHAKSRSVVELCEPMGQYWDDLDNVQQARHCLPWAAEAAEEIMNTTQDRGDRVKVANLLLLHAGALINVGSAEEALALCERSLALFREAQDESGEGRALEYLGDIAHWQGRITQAEAYFERSLTIAQRIGDTTRTYRALLNLGAAMMVQGQATRAEPLLRQSMLIAREQDDQYAMSLCCTHLGWCAFLLDDLAAAEALLQEALNSDRQLHYRTGEGVDVQLLSEVALRRGNLMDAESLCRQSLTIAKEVLDRTCEAQCLELLGRVLLRQGTRTEAVTYLHDGYELARELGLLNEEARALCTLAESAEDADDLPSAETYYRSSIAKATEGENGIVQADALLGLGRVLAKRGDWDGGCRAIHQAELVYQALALPGAASARDESVRLGCMS